MPGTTPCQVRSDVRDDRASRAALRQCCSHRPSTQFKDGHRTTASGFTEVIFIECGTGTDQHGQDLTKAAVRACKDAISWNSIPSLERLVPGGNEGVKIRLQLAVPYESCWRAAGARHGADTRVLSYGALQEPIELMHGGARFHSMCAVPSLGDTADASWVVAVAAVTVGY